jgi:hypothetical protein
MARKSAGLSTSGVVAEAGHDDDLAARQHFLQAPLRFGRHDRAPAAEDVDRRRRDAADVAPQLGRQEASHQIGIALPEQAAVAAPLDAEMRVAADPFRRDALVFRCQLRHELVFARPPFGFLLDAPCEAAGDVVGTLGADILDDQLRDQVRMQPGEHLRHAAAGRVAEQRDALQPQLRHQIFEILDVILDQVIAFGIPIRVAVAAHVDREDVKVAREVRREVVEGVRVPRDPVEQDHRRLLRAAPIEVVQAQAR